MLQVFEHLFTGFSVHEDDIRARGRNTLAAAGEHDTSSQLAVVEYRGRFGGRLMLDADAVAATVTREDASKRGSKSGGE
jgi:hypothetical protein